MREVVSVHGMKMPESCASCPLKSSDGLWLRCVINGQNVEPEARKGTKAASCPLSAVRQKESAGSYEQGRWDMFILLSSVWWGKQCYFLQDNNEVYSRKSGKYMSRDEAYHEFAEEIGDNT